MALATCSSADHSAAGNREFGDRALIVLDDPADAEVGLSIDGRGVVLSCSADCLPNSNEGLVGYGCLPGSREGRVFSCLEDVDGRDGGEGGAPPRRALLKLRGCSHGNCTCSWKIREFLCSILPRGKENVE
jgi:hypothetical protein